MGHLGNKNLGKRSSLNLAGINYKTLAEQKAQENLRKA